jgi:hypothetical protein
MAMEVRVVIDLHEEPIPAFGSEDCCSATAWLSASPSRLVFCAQPNFFRLKSPIDSLKQ